MKMSVNEHNAEDKNVVPVLVSHNQTELQLTSHCTAGLQAKLLTSKLYLFLMLDLTLHRTEPINIMLHI